MTNGNTPKKPQFGPEKAGPILGHIWASIGITIVLGVVVCGIYPAFVWGVGNLLFPIQANGSLLKSDGSFTKNPSEAFGSSLIGQPFSATQYLHPRPSAAGSGYDASNSAGSNLGPLSDKLINGLTASPTPPATQPAESLTFDGIRLRTIHYAVDNNIPFKLYHAVYIQEADGSEGLDKKDEVPLSQFQNPDKSLNDIALVDAFPHPVLGQDAPAYGRIVVIADDFATPIPGDAVTASGSGLDPHISPANAKLQKGRIASARNVTPDQVQTLIDKYTEGPDLGFLGDPRVNVLRLNLALDARFPMPTHAATQPDASTQPSH